MIFPPLYVAQVLTTNLRDRYGLLHRIPIPSETLQASHAYLPSNVMTNVEKAAASSRSPNPSPAKPKIDKGKSKADQLESGYAMSS
jgi:hypothetical protein